MNHEQLKELIAWIQEQEIDYGEISIRFIFHNGQLRFIEKDRKEKTSYGTD